MEPWIYWALGGGGLLLAAGLATKKATSDPSRVASGTAAKPGGLLTSEQARAQQLVPAAQIALARTQEALRDEFDIDTYVGSVRRNSAQQAANVAKGVSATQRSWHLLDRAVDLYPKLPDGKPDLDGKQTEKFRTMHEVAKRFGWRGLAFNSDGSKRYIITTKDGKQHKVWDGGHIEFPEGMTWEQASHQKGGAVVS